MAKLSNFSGAVHGVGAGLPAMGRKAAPGFTQKSKKTVSPSP